MSKTRCRTTHFSCWKQWPLSEILTMLSLGFCRRENNVVTYGSGADSWSTHLVDVHIQNFSCSDSRFYNILFGLCFEWRGDFTFTFFVNWYVNSSPVCIVTALSTRTEVVQVYWQYFVGLVLLPSLWSWLQARARQRHHRVPTAIRTDRVEHQSPSHVSWSVIFHFVSIAVSTSVS